MAQASLSVLITSADRVVFKGRVGSLTFPGEQGTFEALPLHRPLVSRLLGGPMLIDGRAVVIRRGVVCIADDVVTAVVELPSA